jgi:GntR family transcriptional regulator of arabinose operon
METQKTTLKYLQIYEDLLREIKSGKLKPGDRLPSFMQLRDIYEAMPATAERAYARLESENLVIRKARQGVFVAPRQQALTGKIGLLIHSLNQSSRISLYTESLLNGIREGCTEQNVEVLLIDLHEADNAQKTDGVLLYCDKLHAYALGLKPERPHVLLNQRADGIVAVTADDFAGGKLAATHLLELGHKRIAYLMESVYEEPLRRGAGYRAALQQAGIEFDTRWLRQRGPVDRDNGSDYLHWARQNMEQWLDEDWEELGCTAIIAQNDHVAIGIMQVLSERGIRVPEQVSVMGFDGTELCDMVSPRLTSIWVPLHQIGREAVRVLCEQIRNGPHAASNLSLPVRLKPGKSVAPVYSGYSSSMQLSEN